MSIRDELIELCQVSETFIAYDGIPSVRFRDPEDIADAIIARFPQIAAKPSEVEWGVAWENGSATDVFDDRDEAQDWIERFPEERHRLLRREKYSIVTEWEDTE